MSDYIPAPFGPVYPNLPSVEKHRKAARAGKPDDGYGAAVHDAIRALQRSEALRWGVNRSEAKCHCASGTAHNTGKAILKAVAAQNRARAKTFTSCRTAKQWKDDYVAAMAEKRARS